MGVAKRVLGIVKHNERCTGCLRCQLECSFAQTGTFNPSKAAILIQVSDFSKGKEGIAISFSDGCDKCGVCVNACPYGALESRGAINHER